MKKSTFVQVSLITLLLTAPFASQAKPAQNLQERIKVLEAQNASLKQTVQKYEAKLQIEQKNVKQFDDLDYIGWTGKDIKVFEDSHAQNVHVEGMMSAEGLAKHSADAKTYYPMLKTGDGVIDHPIKLAQDDWTAIVGATQSTMTDKATGKDVVKKGYMLTLAKWANGKITEEYLFRLEGDASKSFLNQYVKKR